MPIFTIIAPKIPAEDKDKFLAAWPTFNAELKAQPGVAWVTGGSVVAEDGELVTEAKFVQCLAFKTAEDAETLRNSAWAIEHKEKFEKSQGAEPIIGRFEVAEPPADATPKAFIQFSSIVLTDEAKTEEAKKAWLDLVAAIGKTSWAGGKSIGDGPKVGLGLLGWDSIEEAKAAYEKPEAAAAIAAYRALGQTRSALVRVEYS